MKRIKHTSPAPKCPDYIHSLPKRLADALHSSDQSRNHTGPFTVTITELSVDCGWHRHTVTAFLGKLVALDYLTVEKTPTGFSLLLNDLCVPDL